MKLTIKTAHGYLSVQPDGRLEYRDKVGPWEEFDVDGFEVQPVQPVTPPPSQPDPSSGITPSPTAAYVDAVKRSLLQQGADLSGPCGAFAITKRVAWALRGMGAGLLSKPGGNNCGGFATDIVLFKDGSTYTAADILSDGGGTNGPIWAPTDVDDPVGRWRAPVQP